MSENDSVRDVSGSGPLLRRRQILALGLPLGAWCNLLLITPMTRLTNALGINMGTSVSTIIEIGILLFFVLECKPLAELTMAASARFSGRPISRLQAGHGVRWLFGLTATEPWWLIGLLMAAPIALVVTALATAVLLVTYGLHARAAVDTISGVAAVAGIVAASLWIHLARRLFRSTSSDEAAQTESDILPGAPIR